MSRADSKTRIIASREHVVKLFQLADTESVFDTVPNIVFTRFKQCFLLDEQSKLQNSSTTALRAGHHNLHINSVVDTKKHSARHECPFLERIPNETLGYN